MSFLLRPFFLIFLLRFSRDQKICASSLFSPSEKRNGDWKEATLKAKHRILSAVFPEFLHLSRQNLEGANRYKSVEIYIYFLHIFLNKTSYSNFIKRCASSIDENWTQKPVALSWNPNRHSSTAVDFNGTLAPVLMGAVRGAIPFSCSQLALITSNSRWIYL